MNPIPWLVQGSAPGEMKLKPCWDTVTAPTSREAAIAWLTDKIGAERVPLPYCVNVGPAAPSLRHENGMPHFCKTFTFARRGQ